MINYLLRLRIICWFDAYYQPEKIKIRGDDFRDTYTSSLIENFERTGKCSISKFDSITGTQIEFDNDPNKVL